MTSRPRRQGIGFCIIWVDQRCLLGKLQRPMPWLHAPIFSSDRGVVRAFRSRKSDTSDDASDFLVRGSVGRFSAHRQKTSSEEIEKKSAYTFRPISWDEVFKPRKARRRRTTPGTRKSALVVTSLECYDIVMYTHSPGGGTL